MQKKKKKVREILPAAFCKGGYDIEVSQITTTISSNSWWAPNYDPSSHWNGRITARISLHAVFQFLEGLVYRFLIGVAFVSQFCIFSLPDPWLGGMSAKWPPTSRANTWQVLSRPHFGTAAASRSKRGGEDSSSNFRITDDCSEPDKMNEFWKENRTCLNTCQQNRDVHRKVTSWKALPIKREILRYSFIAERRAQLDPR